GLREFRMVYVYLDDHPFSGEPFANLSMSIQVEDKDADLSNEVSQTVRVRNVEPELTLSLDETTINENETAVLTIDIVDPGILDTFDLTIDWEDGSPVEAFSVQSVFELDALYAGGGDVQGLPTVTEVDGQPIITVVRTHQYLD